MKANPICRVCSVELNDENWYPSYRKANSRICKKCVCEQARLWRKANPEKVKATLTKACRKRGVRSFKENKECSSFLGVHVAERVLSHVFKDVERMPMNHPGYDVICNGDKRIDIKSSCHRKDGTWSFTINHNVIADFFLCLAFDNREDLNPLHAWLIPGARVIHLVRASISPGTIHKWDEYRLDLSKIIIGCKAMRNIISICRQ